MLSNPKLQLTSDFILQATKQILADYSFVPNISFNGFCTDSRLIQTNFLFIAIEGENFDGNQYIEVALNAGASGIICKEGIFKKFLNHPRFKEIAFFGYKEAVWDILAPLASAWRQQFNIPVIGITGSVGKTTTKELVAALLQEKWPDQVLKTQGSQNGYLGIPLTLLQLNHQHRAAVIEIGIDEMGAMEKHILTVSPEFTLLTAIGPEHLEKLRDIQTVASEEGLSLQKTAKNGGFVAINLDDPWIRPFAASIYGKNRYAFTLEGRNLPKEGMETFKAENLIKGQIIENDLEVLNYTPNTTNTLTFKLPLPGEHNARNFLGALCIAKHFEITPDEIQKGISTFKNAFGRSEVNLLKVQSKEVTVLCDYYNANPQSVLAGIKTLCQIAKDKSRKIIVLGDMLELGLQEHAYHKNLVDILMDNPIQLAFLYGPRMISFCTEIKKQNSLLSFPTIAYHFKNREDLTRCLIENLQNGDFILIKGSRGMQMEEVWHLLQK